MSDISMQQRVNQFFKEADAQVSEPIEHIKDAPVNHALAGVSASLSEKDFNQFAELVINDERLNKYLPQIALDTVGFNNYDNTRLSKWVDKNGDGLTCYEIALASATVHKGTFPNDIASEIGPNLIQRKALADMSKNFDKYRGLDPNDNVKSVNPFGQETRDNSARITIQDLGVAHKQFTQYLNTRASWNFK